FRSSLARARHSPYNSRLLHSGAYSSVGQSSRLIIDWSQVQVLLGPPFPSVMSDLIGLFQPEITDFGRSSGAKLRFAKPRLHPAGPTIPFGHVGPHWTIPGAKAALRETRLAFCWTHHLRWSTDLISKLSARPRPPLRWSAAQRAVSVSRSSAAPAACRRAGRPRPIRGRRWSRG